MAFREIERINLPDHGCYVRAACKSTDVKPEKSSYATGSLCHEVDTTKVYAYDENGATGEKWIEQMQFGE